jgi:hypothetical protein
MWVLDLRESHFAFSRPEGVAVVAKNGNKIVLTPDGLYCGRVTGFAFQVR